MGRETLKRVMADQWQRMRQTQKNREMERKTRETHTQGERKVEDRKGTRTQTDHTKDRRECAKDIKRCKARADDTGS